MQTALSSFHLPVITSSEHLSARETYHRSFPLQTLGFQSIWQEPLPMAQYCPELTQ